MRYHQLLAKHISNSGLTLRQIADKCEKRGQKITPSYISKLQSDRLSPPTEQVTRVLASVLNIDSNHLAFLGYVEKAPLIVKEKLNNSIAMLPDKDAQFIKRLQGLSPYFRAKLLQELDWLEQLNSKISEENKK